MNASDEPPLNAPALSVRDLCVSYGPQEVVHHVSFDLRAGERLALLGESGSGKSTIGRAVLGLLPSGGVISRGTVLIGGRDLSRVSAREKDHMRGKVVSLVFQDPLSSLDPIKSIGAHMAEAVRSHANDLDRREVRERSLSLLEIAGLPSSEALLRQYPHELSGGMRQRVLIAAAVAHEPALIVADEPTSALDVKTQFEVLELLHRLSDMRNIGLLLITHDLVVAANTCESALVVRHGRILERGAIAEVFGAPKDPYTKDLMASMSNPRARRPGPESTAGVAGNVETALKMRGIGVGYGYGQARKEVLRGVDLEVMPGETIGVVGESGAGKTTLCRVLLGLVDAKCGEVTVGSSVVNPRFARSHRRRRRNIQIVFQDPFTSMDPRMRVLDVVMQPLKVNTSLRRPAAEIAARNILAEMSVAEDAFERKVRELSGGQQQRVAIARALVLEPDVVVLDEPTSALDAALRIQVLDLLRQKQIELGSAYVFITHDLLAARYFCDRIAVLKDGAIVEVGTAREIFSNPRHLYTEELVNITLAAEHGSTKLGIGKAKIND